MAEKMLLGYEFMRGARRSRRHTGDRCMGLKEKNPKEGRK